MIGFWSRRIPNLMIRAFLLPDTCNSTDFLTRDGFPNGSWRAAGLVLGGDKTVAGNTFGAGVGFISFIAGMGFR
jgi:hypothetical protein